MCCRKWVQYGWFTLLRNLSHSMWLCVHLHLQRRQAPLAAGNVRSAGSSGFSDPAGFPPPAGPGPPGCCHLSVVPPAGPVKRRYGANTTRTETSRSACCHWLRGEVHGLLKLDAAFCQTALVEGVALYQVVFENVRCPLAKLGGAPGTYPVAH